MTILRRDGPPIRVYIEGASPAAMGAPATGTYLVSTSDAALPNATAASGMATGLLKSTTGTGAFTIATGADLPAAISTFAVYVPNDQSVAYTGVPAALADAATRAELNILRAAVENLRAAYEDVRTKLESSPLVV